MSDTYLFHTLEALCTTVGVNGMTPIAVLVKTLLKPYTEDITEDCNGNIFATIPAADANAPVLLLEAHMDEIGFVVTGVEENGFLRVSPCGGVDLRCLAAAPVVVWGKTALAGVFCSTPPHLLEKAEEEKATPADKLFVDIGMSAAAAKETVRIGDRVSFAENFVVVRDDTLVTSKALDNRAGVAAILYALYLLDMDALPYTLKILFACGEELGCRGATPGAFASDADAAIITDVSFAFTPDAPRALCGDLSHGVMVGISPTLDSQFSDTLQQLAQKNDIPFQLEVVGGKTGTDADAISIAKSGIRCALLSTPLRYMHTPVEMVDLQDVRAVGELMAAFVREAALHA